MSDKSFGARKIHLIGGEEVPNITSQNDLDINAVNVAISTNLGVGSSVTAQTYYGDGVNLVGIVTNLVPGIGIDLFPSQTPGNKGQVKVQAYRPLGKTIFVTQNGNDNNTGLTESDAKKTIKAAATVAVFGDTIKVYPGVYVEENPIVLKKTVSVEGTELRNCVVTPKYPYLDLFHVNNGCHITDMSFIGPNMTDGAAVVALQPLQGVSVDRYFDAARMLRLNLDYIARESVGFLTSGFSGFAGNHREQDAARLIDKNLNYISAEAVGFLTSPTGYNFSLSSGDYTNCREDVVSIMGAVSYDLKANSNRKSVGAALSYFNSSGGLIHITGIATQQATIAALDYAVGIAKSVIDNVSPPISYQSGIGSIAQVKDLSVIAVAGGCVGVGTTIAQLVGIVTQAIGAASTSGLPSIRFGVTLESKDCSDDVKDIWKCVIHDITRGGNSRSVDAGKSYYDSNWNLIPQILKNPNEVNQTVATLDYSFGIARSVINNSTWGGYPVGLGTTVTNAVYDNITGVTSITALNHGLSLDDAVKIVGLGFTCPSGPGIVTYPSGSLGYIFNVLRVVDSNNFEVIVGQSTLPHTYVSGGNVQKYTNYQNQISQVKDLGMQKDPLTGFNNGVNGCANVVSAMRSCVGIVTNIVGYGSTAFTSVGIRTTYPGNSGIGFTSILGITSAVYDEVSGKLTVISPGIKAIKGESVEIRNLAFSCSSGGSGISTQSFPSGRYGYDFFIDKVNSNGSFEVYVGASTLPHTYAGGGFVLDRTVAITTATYNHVTGITTIKANGLSIETGDLVKIRGLQFSCPSGSGTTTIYPTGNNGYEFRVLDIVVDKPFNVTNAVYSNITGIATITAPGIAVTYNDLVELRNLEFSCPSSPPNLLYPTGNNGYEFRVLSSIGSTFTVDVGKSTIPHTYVPSTGTVINRTKTANDTFTINVGPSTIPHTYVSGGIAIPEFSRGVGPITQGPYIRNCTNFIGDSIGMKVDGFAAEPGDQDDIGVTGTMSVDSYTQYNQNGIGVSITNGAYAQLVSIFTICDDIAIYTGSGGQCDLTNSNASFGNYGLYSNGVGDQNSKSIYRYTGKVTQEAPIETDTITVSGVGTNRPYDGQALYFGQLYNTVQTIIVDNPGLGYLPGLPPRVIIDLPEGPNGIRAEASANVDVFGRVTSIDVISNGSQYVGIPTVSIDPPPGAGIQAVARATLYPTYYNIASATDPVNGVSTIVLTQTLNNTVGAGTTVYFNRLSLQIATTISFEWVGAGTNINTAKPALGGITNPDNEVVKLNGGQVVYTSTNQAGNFKIGDDITVNQLTGTITGRSFDQSLLNTITPLIIALGK
jgi:hypothetical protein